MLFGEPRSQSTGYRDGEGAAGPHISG
jgi:hypothetical protein